MALKLRQVRNQINQVVKSSKELVETNAYTQSAKVLPTVLLPNAEPRPANIAKDYTTLDLTSSKGKVYRVTMPATYSDMVPKVWSWNPQRFAVAELIAEGVSIREIGRRDDMPAHMTIYGWLQHPEFKEHVDGMVLETGFANKRERIAGLTRMTKVLFDKLIKEIDGVPLTDKSMGAFITGIQATAKQLAQEKEEFVEQSNIEQTTKLSATIVTGTLKAEDLMQDMGADDVALLKAELARMGDSVVNYLTGGGTTTETTKE